MLNLIQLIGKGEEFSALNTCNKGTKSNSK